MSDVIRATARLRCTAVTAYGTLGGAEHWLLALVDSTDRLAVDVVLLQDGPLHAELQTRQVPVALLPTGPRPRDLASRAWQVARRLRSAEVDVVLASGVKAAAVAVPAARLAGVPVVWAKHDFSWDERLAAPLAALADAVVANSTAVAAATGRLDTVVVPPPAPEAVVTSIRAASAFWAGAGHPLPGGPNLAMLGRLVPYKGIDVAIEALADRRAGDWNLSVIGPADPAEPDEQDRLEKLASALGVRDRVKFVPEVRRAGDHLAAFDAVAVLTRRDERGFGREGYSMVALEALAAGVPLIGATGNPEVVRMAEAAGLVVPAGDPEAVAGALARIADPELRRSLGRRGRRLVGAHPDARTCADRVVAVLAETAGRPGAGLVGPSVTVLTCMRNEEGHVDGVMEAVIRQLRDGDEYLVVDDGSTDATRTEIQRWAARDGRVRVLDGPGINLSAARNLGFRGARHGVVVCTDAGCLPADGWLDALRAPFGEACPPALVVGVFHVPGRTPFQEAMALAGFPHVAEARRRTPYVRAYNRLFGRAFSSHRLDGRSMAVTVEAWSAAGGFDESLFSSEDAVFGHRVLATAGHSVLALDAVVEWEQPARPREMLGTFAKYGVWGARARDRGLVGRDLARMAGYVLLPLAAARAGTAGRLTLVAGAAAYLSLPARRAVRESASAPGAALIPVALVSKDLAKAWGCLRGLTRPALDGATR